MFFAPGILQIFYSLPPCCTGNLSSRGPIKRTISILNSVANIAVNTPGGLRSSLQLPRNSINESRLSIGSIITPQQHIDHSSPGTGTTAASQVPPESEQQQQQSSSNGQAGGMSEFASSLLAQDDTFLWHEVQARLVKHGDE